MTTPTINITDAKRKYLETKATHKQPLLDAYNKAVEALQNAIDAAHNQHSPLIDDLKKILIEEFNHPFPKSKVLKGSKASKERKPRTKIDLDAIVAKIRTVLAGGKKLNGSQLQKELGINYPAFKKVIDKHPNLLSSNEKGVSVLYSLK
jgi:hypothetical protein